VVRRLPPQSQGGRECLCVFFCLVCLYVFPWPCTIYIFHMPMTRYSLFVLKVSLNTNKTKQTKQFPLAEFSVPFNTILDSSDDIRELEFNVNLV